MAYADDITVLISNDNESVNSIFSEYYRLTKASGLTLNADKTEKFNFYSRNLNQPDPRQVVRHGNQEYNLHTIDTIKLNGVIFNRDKNVMRQVNLEGMIEKMARHFKEWSRRSLSLLGKIQIIKTFGISQFLYALAVVDIDEPH